MSFLSFLEKNYNTFEMFNGSLGSFEFPEDVKQIIYILMRKNNPDYQQMSERYGNNPMALDNIFLKKDVDGKCYLEIVGQDNKSVVIIMQDNRSYEAYKNVRGKKYCESEFAQILEQFQLKRFEKAKQIGIPKRFLNPNPSEFNLLEELDAQRLVEYYKYLSQCYLSTISTQRAFDEPEATQQTKPRRNLDGITSQRKNDVIDYELRRQELLKYKPKYIINFIGRKMSEEIDAFVYQKDNFIIVVAEPHSGESYTKILNLGMIDISNKQLIENNIQAALEASEDIVLADDAIIRKSHTTLEIFKKNLEVLFNNNKEMYRFIGELKQSDAVYKR